ncbi:MAG TPA: hypothetical protein VLB83_05590 [Candidatus Paceibacterota bacterium]|nr:hypothetical protein [Candidatus Paceibacterota bacterium]
MKKYTIAGIVAALALPSIAFATNPLNATLTTFASIVSFLIPVLMSLAVLVFFWGLVKYIASASDEAAKESGKTLMIWGMIALFVMVAFWGIIGYFQTALGLSGTVTSSAPPVVALPIPSVSTAP